MTSRVRIASVAVEFPSSVRSSEEIEARILDASPGLQFRRGVLEARTGIRSRRVAADDIQCSDLASAASHKAMAKAGVSAGDIDLLIFASAGQDLIEPATAHIVQDKLGTRGPVFDVKNACNSFLNGLQLAEALILSGAHDTVLVTAGEICSRAIQWRVSSVDEFRRHFPAYMMGDAGAACVVTRSSNGEGIFFRSFASRSEHWPLATVPCGGSMHPRGDEYTYLQGDGPALRRTFADVGPVIFAEMLEKAGCGHESFDRIFIHQVSVQYHRELLDRTGMHPARVESTVEEYGNLASVSIPAGFALAQERGAIRCGDRIMWIGMASGISVGIFMMEW